MVGPATKSPERPEAEGRGLGLPRRFRRNVLSSYVRTGSGALIGIVMVPVLVNGLGKAAYGVWVIVNSFTASSEIFRLGVAKATPKYVAEHMAQGSTERTRSVAATSFWVLTVLAMVALPFGLLLAAFFPDLFHVGPGISGAAQALIVILVVNVVISIPCDTFGGVLIGLQRFDLLNWTLVAMLVAQAAGAAVVIVAGGGLVPLGIVTITANLLAQLWIYLVARRLIPGLNASPRRVRRKLVRQVAGLSVWFATIDIANILLTTLDTIIIGFVLGVEAAAVYGVAEKLPLAVGRLMTPVSGVFFPHSSDLSARDDLSGLRTSVVTGTRLLLGIGLPLAMVMAILASPIIHTWVGSGFGGAAAVVAILCGSLVVSSVSQAGLQMLQGMGKARVPALIYGGGALLNIGLSIPLAYAIGIKGVALGGLIAVALTSLFGFFPYMCRQFQLALWPFVRALLAGHAPPAAAGLAIGWLVTRGDSSGVPYLAGAAAAILAAYLFVFAFTGLDARERRLVGSRLRRMTSRPATSA